MQIGSATPYVAPSPSPLSARALSSADSVGPSSPELNRSNQSPVTPTPAPGSDEQASLREEADSPGNGEDAKSSASDAEQQRQQQAQVTELASRDREVRAHEQAHAAVGGTYAGAPSYSYKRGPDGKSYVVSGEVSIDVSPIPNDPQATLRKMEVVQRAALAPAEPSSQDRRVAAQAQAMAAQARTDLAQQQREEAVAASEERRLRAEEREQERLDKDKEKEEKPVQQPPISAPSLDLYRGLNELPSPEPMVDLLA
ncbi:hypothetical protein HNE05_16000 [Aquipseudomonas campi]|uniref:SprA-related family protein n=1 Tax=Aquipseudomonas campi TaxID=2731681 RepID=A0A6M8FVA6_9GAMM|nr:putative metalloprotease CJM1_0395 family protein [Pseudomonas campi]QKE64788.1 hypothetical protein HNE05_16000 [Pseudomonas campi]